MSSIYLQSETDSKSNLSNNIQDIIKCYICLGKIKNPCMCPKCQKLTCEECIQKWLLEKKNQCPHCRSNLNFNQLIHLSFMTDVANYIDKISASKKAEEAEVCQKHQIQILYYCSDCGSPLCSDCYMLEDKHKKHRIKKIDEVYRKHLELIKIEKEDLDIEENTLRRYLKDISEKIIEIGNTKYRKIKETEEFFVNIRNKIQNQSQEAITNLLEKKQNIELKLKEIQNYMKNFSFQIKNSTKNEIINRSNDLIKTLKEIKLKILIENSDIDKFPNNFSLTIQNPLVPKYETGIFEVRNFESINSDKVMYSQEMRIGGLTWKMKLYPKGNPTSKGEYISIFLELQYGVSEPSKYYYILELINFKNKRNYFMEYSSNFTNGECWGYSKFYKIKKLKEDGFISENGDLVIKVHIRPESFEQLSRDLKGYIDLLESKINESIIGEEEEDDDEEGGEEEDEIDEKNITGNYSLSNINIAKNFLIDFKKFNNNKNHDNNKKGEENMKNKKNILSKSNYSFDDFEFRKNNNLYSNCHIGINTNINNNKNKHNQKQEREKDKKNNIINSLKNINNINTVETSESKKKYDKNNRDKNINFQTLKKNNNSQVILATKETETNNIKRMDFKTEKKYMNENNGLINFHINNSNNINGENFANSINDSNRKGSIKKFDTKKSNNNNDNNNIDIISPINKLKLSNMVKNDLSMDSEEEQKKMDEDPYLIPKDKDHQFITSDDSFGFLVESMKFSEDKKEKNNILPEEKLNEINNNINTNIKYQNLIRNLEKNRNKDRERNRDKEYGRIRNSNNNFERKYAPFRNVYNYYGNGLISDKNEFDNYKKKYYK